MWDERGLRGGRHLAPASRRRDSPGRAITTMSPNLIAMAVIRVPSSSQGPIRIIASQSSLQASFWSPAADQLNFDGSLALARLSGNVSRTLDIPASRASAAASATYGSIEAAKMPLELLGHLAFTPYGQRHSSSGEAAAAIPSSMWGQVAEFARYRSSFLFRPLSS